MSGYKREGSAPTELEPGWVRPIEVKVESGSREDFERAMKRFKALFNSEHVLGSLKEKSSFEKPSARKRRKKREAIERAFLDNLRQEMIKTGEWDKRQRQKEIRKIKKAEKNATVNIND
jgi:ribosomal protein S21